MPIQLVSLPEIVCDSCGYCECFAYETIEQAKEHSKMHGWVIDGDTTYCARCMTNQGVIL